MQNWFPNMANMRIKYDDRAVQKILKQYPEESMRVLAESTLQFSRLFAPIRTELPDIKHRRKEDKGTARGAMMRGMQMSKIKKGRHAGAWAVVGFEGYTGIVEKGHAIVTGGKKEENIAKKRRGEEKAGTVTGKVRGRFFIRKAARQMGTMVSMLLADYFDKQAAAGK